MSSPALPRRFGLSGPGGERLALAALLAVGLWLRWSLNGAWRLGPDEALYSTWARHIASGADPWLAATAGVDKPPLLMYTIALAMHIYGYYEFASRFPSIVASTLTVLLTFLLARRLYSQTPAALFAALLAALSPFAVLYAPTAFADPLLVMWVLAVLLAVADRPLWAGAAAALAILTKQEAVLLLPAAILVGMAPLVMAARPLTARALAGRLLRSGAVCAIVALGVEAGWEAARPVQPSPFALGLQHYGVVALVGLGDIAPRLAGWQRVAMQYIFASPALNAASLVAVVAVPLFALARRPARWQADIALWLAFVYLVAARTLISFQLWHRYMLVAVPFLCVLLARGVALLWQRVRGHWSLPAASALLPALLIAALLLAPLAEARAGRLPVGSDHGQYTGIDETARFVRENVPPGSVIFHHSLGWQLGYYLYGAHLDFWWYPTVQWLAETAAGRAGHSQYIIVPSWESAGELAAALQAQGLVLLPVHSARRPDGSVSFETFRVQAASRGINSYDRTWTALSDGRRVRRYDGGWRHHGDDAG